MKISSRLRIMHYNIHKLKYQNTLRLFLRMRISSFNYWTGREVFLSVGDINIALSEDGIMRLPERWQAIVENNNYNVIWSYINVKFVLEFLLKERDDFPANSILFNYAICR